MLRYSVGTLLNTIPTGTNLVPNPSFETNTTGWDLDAVFTRDNTKSMFGSYAIKQASTSGFDNFTTHNDSNIGVPLITNTQYVASFYYNIVINSGFAPQWEINYGNAFGSHFANGSFFDTGGNWRRLTVSFNSSSQTHFYFRIYNNNGNVTAYYDGFQVEASNFATDYIDGSLGTGFAWTGTANNSSSTRTVNTTATNRNNATNRTIAGVRVSN